MKTTIWHDIPRVSDDGTVSIPAEDWEPVIRAVKNDFKGEIFSQDHDEPDVHHGCLYGPAPHYLVAITTDEDKAFEALQTVDPMIYEIAMRNTRKVDVRS